ncbi:hypothetical protein N7452_011278 [Penicillium brevicompactum]|uniref:Ell binding protein Ebp1 C-terminal domain-containing protein n=1 Tax=Penicillium brevicompactum TaxID=5074 RepID=A0A9W9Q288_PENBR|nr:hypothetical protein N7452_011278 [Penicillium brevicompactum]
MSVNERRHSQHTPTPPAARSSESAREALDRRLQRLSDEVLPAVPYILTLPTKAPFHLGSRATDNWAVGHDRPFSAEEQELQYMTFLTHHNTDSLLVAVGDWADETGRMMDDRSNAQNTAEGSRDTGAKKKISLKDYKDQKTSGAVASPMGPDAGSRGASSSNKPEGKRQTTSSGSSRDVHKTEKLQSQPKSQVRHRSPNRAGQKRPSGSEREFVHSRGTKDPEAHSPKKPRRSPERETRRDHSPSKSHSPKLPALLSPTLPPTPTGSRLPRLLSPTLPPDIEKELASFEDLSPRLNVVEKSAPAKDASQRDTRDNTRTLPTKSQMIVKLRYGRANRKRVEALLKFNGKPKSHRSDSPISQDTDRDNSNHIKKKGADLGLSRIGGPKGKKHDTDEHIGSREGRTKEPKGSAENPRTPVPQPPPTPHSAAHEKPKPSSITPAKELKPSRRTDVAESDTKYPSHPPTQRHSVDSGSTAKASPTPTDSRSRHDRQVWTEEWQKFTTLGRELKHEAARITNKHGASSADEKLAAVTAIEALLSFILAFVAHDQAIILKRQTADSSTWLSIVAYWRAVKKSTTQFPVLTDICSLLGAVSYGAIHSLDLERLSSMPFPGEHPPNPTPGSDGNAALQDEKKLRKDLADLRGRLLESYKHSQRLWLDGTRGLSEDVLERDFPTSWSERSQNYSERGRPSLKARDYSGSYFLPFSSLTPPIEVVRFSWVLLKEWCSKQRVDWNGRLNL